ncbi:TatA/E family protein of Tat protein translocase [Desulfohalotomaculum tongense]|uniref:Sec-independent protein translocase subunit TatA/TatB n=1 Tax=Desulforadius tongensis TaxID=1216062 RepID=UPI001957CFF7|nr:twin-arginine translocase TatA/TatE family subunit [Desulforadius tongensis]MBM7854090.1 TatA/E family protein of Tat protein translocase [Desulforadius tongensis]
MLNFSFWDIILILIVSLIVFGPNKLPDVARSMGKGMAEFRRITSQATEAYKEETSQLKKEFEVTAKDEKREENKKS